ncbi:mixed lineage kinase domain-like protein [Gadus chalcogrammus]|uniref:mixed lineage kinase domain-like protein n=1 Tax=Gadus chalcogrammus TaxID=1042646 RepID=UPI0024C4AA83|nr:mixed lineage kinase domain-like protein [Gadus chalcogrammus]
MMETIEPILSLATSIYHLVGEVQANRKRCERVAERVRELAGLVTALGGGASTADSKVKAGLEKLMLTLRLAEDLIRKYADARFLKRLARAYHLGEDFADVNDRLNDAYQVLSLALQVEQSQSSRSAFEEARRLAEDQADQQDDARHFRQILEATQETLNATQETVNATQEDVQKLRGTVETLIQTVSKSRMVNQDIRVITADELTYDTQPFMTSPTSEVYRGEYNKFTVAIKRFTTTASTSSHDIQRVFHKEIETMRRFESPNILRMFGICVQDENGPSPTFLIVMEYCEKGSLRQVLDSPRALTWARRAGMSLDAARGLYRLHQTEDKAKVHGCINSSKFLVAEGYRVKLGGLELAKTETSLRKSSDGQTSSLRYCSPQQLQNVNYVYNKKCEIYSFGIVLWEIATRKKPFEDCSTSLDIFNKVITEKVVERLPDDCPPALRTLIDACRSLDDFKRPSAGVVVDKLRRVVDELEEE